jgi:hypothetical protein
MATSKKVKRLARVRQRTTGERYTTALVHVQQKGAVMQTQTVFGKAVEEAKAQHAREWDLVARDEICKQIVAMVNEQILPLLRSVPVTSGCSRAAGPLHIYSDGQDERVERLTGHWSFKLENGLLSGAWLSGLSWPVSQYQEIHDFLKELLSESPAPDVATE